VVGEGIVCCLLDADRLYRCIAAGAVYAINDVLKTHADLLSTTPRGLKIQSVHGFGTRNPLDSQWPRDGPKIGTDDFNPRCLQQVDRQPVAITLEKFRWHDVEDMTKPPYSVTVAITCLLGHQGHKCTSNPQDPTTGPEEITKDNNA